MFRVNYLQDADIQGGDTPYDLTQLTVDGQLIFATEEFDKLVAAIESQESGSWIIEADRNSAELGEFYKLRLTKDGQVLHLAVQKTSQAEFAPAADITAEEFTKELQSIVLKSQRTTQQRRNVA